MSQRSAWDELREFDRSPLAMLSYSSSVAQKLEQKKEFHSAYENAKKSNGLISLQLSKHDVHVTSHVRKKQGYKQNNEEVRSPEYSLEARIEHIVKKEKENSRRTSERKENRHRRNRPAMAPLSYSRSNSDKSNSGYVPRTRRGRLAVAASHGNKVFSKSPSLGVDDISSDEDSPRQHSSDAASLSPDGPLSSTARFAQRTRKNKRTQIKRCDSHESVRSHYSDQEAPIATDETTDTPTKQNYKSIISKNNELINMLQSQLLSNGVKPILEVVSYETAELRLKAALQQLMEGDERAEEAFNQWDEYIRNHPQYKENQENARLTWIRDNETVNKHCQIRMRSLVPPDIIKSSLSQIQEHLPTSVAKRIWSKKALWLTRIPRDKIAKLHVADLQTKYSVQGLDEIELRAIWASLPEKFDNDPMKAKENWKLSLLQTLQSKHSSAVPPYPTEEGADMTAYHTAIVEYASKVARNPAYRQLVVEDTYGPFDPIEVFIEEEPVEVIVDVLAERAVGKLHTRRHSVATPSREVVMRQLSSCSEIGGIHTPAKRAPDMMRLETNVTTPEQATQKKPEERKVHKVTMNPKLGGVASVLSAILAKAATRPT